MPVGFAARGPIAIPSFIPTTWDPTTRATAHTIMSNGDLTVEHITNAHTGIRTVASYSTGKHYMEQAFPQGGGNTFTIGLGIVTGDCLLMIPADAPDYIPVHTLTSGGAGGALEQRWHGEVYSTVATSGTNVDSAVGDTLCMAVDLDNDKIWWRENGGNWNNNGSADPATNVGGYTIDIGSGPFYCAESFSGAFDTHIIMTANFGATAFAYGAPAGFSGW